MRDADSAALGEAAGGPGPAPGAPAPDLHFGGDAVTYEPDAAGATRAAAEVPGGEGRGPRRGAPLSGHRTRARGPYTGADLEGPRVPPPEATRLDRREPTKVDLVQAAAAEDPRLIDRAIRELALEIAELGFLVRRARARRTAKASQLAGQRIRSLTRVAGLVLLKARAGFLPADEPPAELLGRLKELFLNEVLAVGRDTVGPALAVELLRRVGAKLDGVAGEVEVRSDL